LLHAPLLRRWAVGIFDPLLVVLVTGVLSSALVGFMWLNGDAPDRLVASFATCHAALLGGMAFGRRITRDVPFRPLARDADARAPALAFGFSAAVHVGATLTIWSVAGIPLFRASRLGAFAGSGGLGILERLAESSGLIAVFCAVYLLVADPRRRGHPAFWLFSAWMLASVALSGSKGALLALVQAVFTTLRQQRGRYWGGRTGLALIAASTAFAVATLATQEGADLRTALVGLAVRIVAFGDVYVYAYPGALIDQLQGDSALIGMFGGFLSTFRLFPLEWLQPNLGLQFTSLAFPDLDLVVGPNPQHAVLGYHYFGVLAPLFSFALGAITTTSQQQLYHGPHRGFLGSLSAFLLYFTLVSLAVDFEYTLSRLASVMIGVVVVFVPVWLLQPSQPVFRKPAPRGTAAPGA
jgi:hypothetical protein